jgi:hypothetical protein
LLGLAVDLGGGSLLLTLVRYSFGVIFSVWFNFFGLIQLLILVQFFYFKFIKLNRTGQFFNYSNRFFHSFFF